MSDGQQENSLLVGNFRAGDTKAFESIYARWRKSLIAYVSAEIRRVELAEEMVQDCFRALWKERKKMQSESHIRNFLFGAARHAIIDNFRDKSKKQPLANTKLQNHRDLELEDKEERSELLKALQKIPKDQKEVIRLKLASDMSFTELGEALNISAATAKSRWRLGIENIKALLPDAKE